MPIYEYECRSCGRRTEAMQRLADPPLTECEECGGELRKLISAPAFHLKGSGWYATDYAKGGSGNGKPGEAGKSGDTGKSEESGKPAEAKGGGKGEGSGAKEGSSAPAAASSGSGASTTKKSGD